LMKTQYMRVEQVPVEQFRDFRYAVYLALFADAGSTWYRNQPVALDRFYSGYGAGIHISLPYSIVARFEFGIPYNKPLSNGEFIFDLGSAL
jgi:hemolysin activation/secretion protein